MTCSRNIPLPVSAPVTDNGEAVPTPKEMMRRYPPPSSRTSTVRSPNMWPTFRTARSSF